MNNDDLLKSAKTVKEEKYRKRYFPLTDEDRKLMENDEPAWMAELDRKYEEMWLEKWGKDEDYIKFLQAQKSLEETALNEENEDILDILKKSIELVEASKVFFEKIRESRPKVRIKIS